MAGIPSRYPPSERGAALLIMLLVLVLGAAVLFSRSMATQSQAAARARSNDILLAEAKQALLGYASTWDATHPGELGFLPCPDLNASGGTAEGEAHENNCGARYRSMLGRFPWRTLGIDPRRVEGGECLWYAVSGSWKAAGTNKPELLNWDSSGQFQVQGADGGLLIAGLTPADRAVAVLIAPGPALPGQNRAPLATGTEQCGGNFNAAAYLDTDPLSGIVNALLGVLPDAVDSLVSGAPGGEAFNDQVLFITRGELESRLRGRADVTTKLNQLTAVVARCIADYGKRNPGGAGDKRLPWPAPVDLVQYRTAAQYNDTPIGELSGRVPNVVNDSNSRTGNSSTGVLTACNPATVPTWTPEMQTLWQHWKDHLFYAVARDFRPDAPPATGCSTCLSVNGSGTYAGIVLFAGPRLAAAGQTRDEPPMNTDTRGSIDNYLEGRNAGNHPNAGGNGNYQSGTAGSSFNDVLYCIDANLGVAPC